MSQAEYQTWLLLSQNELTWLRRLSRMNIHLLAHGQDMGYQGLISFLGEYSAALDAWRESEDVRGEWRRRDLAPHIPSLEAVIARRRDRVSRQQERVSPMLDRILAACPQKAPRLVLDASGRFSIE